MSFPEHFVWGAATASYQIEGNIAADGRGPSVWDEYCAQPGRVYGGHSGTIACDHYNRSAEDVALMKAIGLQAYRFSVAWPRVLPTGRGAINTKGLEFYDRLVDQLLAAGIEPWLTLFHWDYPLALYRLGGWLHPDSPRWFADYATVVVEKLSDRVSRWITLNEPQCFIGLGLHLGTQAPGDKLPMKQALQAAHHTLLAHGLAVQIIRSHAKLRPIIGWAPTGEAAIPATESADDADAAREYFWKVESDSLFNMAWWLDPVLRGHYPEEGRRAYGDAVPAFTETEMRTINQPLDFIGLNLYHGHPVRRGADGSAQLVPREAGEPRTHYGWPVAPAALYWGPALVHERYGLPLVITENGMANLDWVALDGGVHDPQRIDFLARYLRELERAVGAGIPVQAYFAWSLLDNFEWSDGYRYRFGLVHVDYVTQQRTLKDSAIWYRDFIRAQSEIVRSPPGIH